MYEGANLSRVAYPLGGMGAGMLCLEGTGALSHVSLRNRPDVFHEPCIFAALSLQLPTRIARVLEGPVPGWKLFGRPETGRGAPGTSFGLPRFRNARFDAQFPFGRVMLSDAAIPLDVEITGWSPFVPNEADCSSLPVAALEYRFANRSERPVAATFSFNARSFMGVDQGPHRVERAQGGFALWGTGAGARAWDEGWFSATVSEADVVVNHAWFRGGWYDPLTLAWKDIVESHCPARPPVAAGPPAPGASLYVPLPLAPGAARTIVVRLAWYAARTDLRIPRDSGDQPAPPECHVPWYAGRFSGIEEVTRFWAEQYAGLRAATEGFTRVFYDSTLPPEVIEAVAANLTILKSPTVLRQADGRLWAWEGCADAAGSCRSEEHT